MARVADHLSVAELRVGYRGGGDATRARHHQVIWLLAQGRTVAETARLTSFAPRWIEALLARYNAFGPSSLGDRRRGNGAKARVLTPEVLATLRERLKTPPDDGGVWTSRKVAAVMAAELGLGSVAEQRGGQALRAIGWHGAPGLAVPEGIRLVHLPPYTPELQPAETLWTHVDEPIVDRHFDTLAEFDAAVARQCVALNADRDRIKGQAGFNWWPDRIVPN